MRPDARLSRPRTLRLAAWGLVVFGMFGCVDAVPRDTSGPSRTRSCPLPADELRPLATPGAGTEAVVVVVLDGARWQDVLVGVDPSLAPRAPAVPASQLMPNLHAMIAGGVLIGGPGEGKPMVASGPNFVSLPGYNEIFSGRSPSRCQDNDCPQTQEPTIVDRAPEAAVFSSWGPIARAASAVAASGPRGLVVSTGQPDTGEFRSDRETARAALVHLAQHRPRFLFLGLGEPDEFAHRGDYPGYLESLRRADGILGELHETLRALGERGDRTSVFVTCDHGRGPDFRNHGAAWPESSRVWLVAAGGLIPARGAVSSPATRRLADIAPTVRKLLGLPADRSPGAGNAIAELFPQDPLDPREARR